MEDTGANFKRGYLKSEEVDSGVQSANIEEEG